VAAGRPVLRSVDSECAGRVIEPRNQYCGGGRRLGSGGRQHRRTVPVWCGRPRRGHRAGHARMGTPQEPGRPGRLRGQYAGRGSGLKTSRPPRAASARGRSEQVAQDTVPPSEGNEARRKGRPGVGAPRSTRESGEPSHGVPRGGKGAPGCGTIGGKDDGDIELRNRLNKTATDSEAGERDAAFKRTLD